MEAVRVYAVMFQRTQNNLKSVHPQELQTIDADKCFRSANT